MPYVFAFKHFLRKLRANPALRDIIPPGATRYSAYADDVSILVKSSAKVEEVSK